MKALIAMSGGVDSSVAAYLIKSAGFACVGCTMKLFSNEAAGIPRTHACCSLSDVEDARSVAYQLHMPYYVFHFAEDFQEKVIRKFVESYEGGMTPNPCIDCNRYMKFQKLFDRARILHCDYVVTGHYARIERHGERFMLKKAVDETKDQSYVLYTMTQEQLAHTLMPLGALHKTETRRIAEKNGFINADKPDSQDICFVPDGDYAKVIERQTGRRCPAGDFISADGDVLGRHRGIIHYTVGQRRGLGISGSRPLYVCKICPEKNTVVLGGKEDLFSDTALVTDVNWIGGEAPGKEFPCHAKIRYRQRGQPATASVLDRGSVRLTFREPQRAVTPGQAAVLYDGEIVLGGGTIVR